MKSALHIMAKLIYKAAKSGANATSTWHAYQPKLPKELQI